MTEPLELLAAIAQLEAALRETTWIPRANYVTLLGDLERLGQVAAEADRIGTDRTLNWLAGGPGAPLETRS